jgi:hypothetical protein
MMNYTNLEQDDDDGGDAYYAMSGYDATIADVNTDIYRLQSKYTIL